MASLPKFHILQAKQSFLTAPLLSPPSRLRTGMEGSSYEYTVAAEDPDKDAVEFSLSAAPDGMTIDSATGLIRWQVSEEQKEGSFQFKVIASDPEGAQSIQPVTLKLSSGGEGGQTDED